ncbi:MAG TPA: PDZ domain-containing protein [Pyrinomonadaceae bacterium]
MTVRRVIQIATIGGALLCGAVAVAQTPATSTKKPMTPPKAAKVSADKLPSAPQVVTIIHRLNGLKMFRLLLRSEQQVQAIENVDSAFNLMDDVHTNVTAGLAMDDGETIAAWLPEAEVELDAPLPPAPPSPRAPKPPRTPVAAFPRLQNGFFQPDITVIGPEGQRVGAKYIGFDAVTGLSILRLEQKNATTASAIKDEPVNAGDTVLLFSPEPVTKARAMAGAGVYARMGALEGRVQNIVAAPSGGVARFKVAAAKLSHANIGGVALNEAGETIGIVDGLEGNEASILPVALIKRAAQRVLEQQSSVPRPWLGVKGEAVAELKLDQILNQGWEMQRAAALADERRGIMLTSIAPNSPAAMAALRAGDVILKVDDKDIRTADDFTWWLEQAGPRSSVEFTVARPDRLAEEPVNVKLSEKLDRSFTFTFDNRVATTRGSSLLGQGIETVALRPPVASQLGTTAGLLVVYVEPQTPASEAGLQAGDVIQSINGKPVSTFKATTQPASFTLEIVRNKQKLVVTVPVQKKQ